MNPLINLQTGWVPPAQVSQPNMTWQQGMPSGLMGNVLQQPQQSGLMGGNLPSLQNVQPGDWSSVAYNMAGRPIQGPSPAVTPPPMPPGVLNGTQSSGGGGIGGTALGLLGALAKNPSLLKSGYNAISGLFGPTAAETAGIGPAADAAATEVTGQLGAMPVASILPAAEPAISGLMAGASPELAQIGTSAIAPAVDAAAADAAAALGATAAGAAAAPAGLAASGSFATGGGAAAASSAPSAAGSLGAGATAAAVAAPFIFQQAGLALGDAWTAKNSQGNTAMKGWMQSAGAHWVPNPKQSNSGNTFQSQQFSTANNPGTMYDASGKAMTGAQAAAAIYNWALANHVNPGDFHPT
jgi:hypothetical protein